MAATWTAQTPRIIRREKFCPHCKETKPSAAFTSAPKRGDGLQSWCRACMNERTRIRRKDEAYREQERVYARKKRAEEMENRRASGWTPYAGHGGVTWDIDHMIAVSEARNALTAAYGCDGFAAPSFAMPDSDAEMAVAA